MFQRKRFIEDFKRARVLRKQWIEIYRLCYYYALKNDIPCAFDQYGYIKKEWRYADTDDIETGFGGLIIGLNSKIYEIRQLENSILYPKLMDAKFPHVHWAYWCVKNSESILSPDERLDYYVEQMKKDTCETFKHYTHIEFPKTYHRRWTGMDYMIQLAEELLKFYGVDMLIGTSRKRRIVFFTGSGVSKESGIPTFRDNDGLWEQYPVDLVATITGWESDPKFVNEFYNILREKYVRAGADGKPSILPNHAHKTMIELAGETEYTDDDCEIIIITQNVDDLHERALISHINDLIDNAEEGDEWFGKPKLDDPYADLMTTDSDEESSDDIDGSNGCECGCECEDDSDGSDNSDDSDNSDSSDSDSSEETSKPEGTEPHIDITTYDDVMRIQYDKYVNMSNRLHYDDENKTLIVNGPERNLHTDLKIKPRRKRLFIDQYTRCDCPHDNCDGKNCDCQFNADYDMDYYVDYATYGIPVKIIHLHGIISKMCADGIKEDTDYHVQFPYDHKLTMPVDTRVKDIFPNETRENIREKRMRPYVVWFGEDVPNMSRAIMETEMCDAFVVVGTSLQVYPAATLLDYVPMTTPIVFIDPEPDLTGINRKVEVIKKSATEGMDELKGRLDEILH